MKGAKVICWAFQYAGGRMMVKKKALWIWRMGLSYIQRDAEEEWVGKGRVLTKADRRR